jgi:hypothetical protein
MVRPLVELQIHNHRALEMDGQRIVRRKKVLKSIFAPMEMERPSRFRDFINMNTHDVLVPRPIKR